jgi:hypothetical protein
MVRRQGGARRLAAQGAYLACLRVVSERGLAEAMAKTFRARQARRGGAQRSSDRTLAIHLAREAFGVQLYALGRAAGLHPRSAQNASLVVWERRDLDPDFDRLLWTAVRELRMDA